MQEFINIANNINYKVEMLDKKMDALTKTHSQILKEEWITKEQVMQILRIKERTFQKIRHQITYSKIKGIYLFSTQDLEKIIKENIVKK